MNPSTPEAESDQSYRWPRWVPVATLVSIALVSFAVAHTPEDGTVVDYVTLASPRGLTVPAIRVVPSDESPRGTALLVHGITGSREMMRRHAEALALVGFRCLAIDLPAHGDSSTRLNEVTVMDAYAAGVEALSDDGQIDVLVGHSFGGGNGAIAIERGIVRPSLFVSIGARPSVEVTPTIRVLFVAGALDLQHPPDELRRHAAACGAEAVVVSGVDHAMEPFAPGVVNVTVHAASTLIGSEPRLTGAWGWRLVGCAGLVSCAVAAVLLLPRGGALIGFAAGGLLMVAAVAGLHGKWLYVAPSPGRALVAMLWILAAWGCSLALATAFRPVPWLKNRRALASQLTWTALTTLLFVIPALAGAAWGRTLLMFGVYLICLLAVATAFSALVQGRTGRESSAHTAFAVVVGYGQGAWIGSFLLLVG